MVAASPGYGEYKNGGKIGWIGWIGKVAPKMAQDRDKTDNENHDRFQRIEDLLRGVSGLVEKISLGEPTGQSSSTGHFRPHDRQIGG